MSKILYLGDGPLGSAANYLLGILKRAGYETIHLYDKKLNTQHLKNHFSAIIISDYSSRNISTKCMVKIKEMVSSGTGLLMIGGWSSFYGLSGHYNGTLIEKILPVKCLQKDDRKNLASGATFEKKSNKPFLKNIPLKPSPVIIGYNVVKQKKNAKIILELQETASKKKNPLLVVGTFGKGKTAAFTTDVAPHWCGGLVDWGKERVKIQVVKGIQIEVGHLYVRFLTQLIRWVSDES